MQFSTSETFANFQNKKSIEYKKNQSISLTSYGGGESARDADRTARREHFATARFVRERVIHVADEFGQLIGDHRGHVHKWTLESKINQ